MLDECKEKLNYVQQMVKQRIADVLDDEMPAGSYAESDTCRFNNVDQERHRTEACERLKNLANDWNLSTIAEISRSRISTVSLTGRISAARSLGLNPMPDGSDVPEDVFESVALPLAGKRLFQTSTIPRVTHSRTESDSSSCQTEPNAAGDQLSSTPPAKIVQADRFPPSDELAVTSTVSDFGMDGANGLVSEPVVKPKRKPVGKKAKAPAKDPVIKVKAPAKPRTRKKAVEASVPAAGGNEKSESPTMKPCNEPQTPVRTGLRPRRKAANYRE